MRRRAEVGQIIAQELASDLMVGIDIHRIGIDDLLDTAADKAAKHGLLAPDEKIQEAFPGLVGEVSGYVSPDRDEETLSGMPNVEYLRHLPIPETGDAA